MVFMMKGRIHYRLHDLPAALSDYTSAIEYSPWDEEAHTGRAEVQLDMKRYDGALADLAKSIELDENCARAYYIRSRVYTAQGKKEQAKADLKKAQDLGMTVLHMSSF
jgi:tetratricopeptide (TPR) repeat protein